MGKTHSRSHRAAAPVGAERRLFTIEKANASLVLVRRVVAEIVVEFRRLLDLQEMVETAEQLGNHLGASEAREQLRDTFGRLEDCRDELREIGVELKDWLRGIVHFPSLADGREVYLCWRHGEQRVAYWHEKGCGLAQRESVSLLRSAGPESEGTYFSDNAPIRRHDPPVT